MGCLSCTWTFTKLFLVCAVITFMPGIPPHTEFKEYTVARPRALDAELLARKSLDKAEHLFEGQITGPEAFAVYNGAVYTGIHGGFVVQIDEGELKPVVKFGQNCDDITEEHICGRPLGLKFDAAGNLYVVDAYYGVFKYNIQKAEKTLLVGVDEEIEGKPSKFMNDLAVAKDGTVYITVTSTTFPLYDGLYALFAPGDGRIIKYDPKSKKTTVLADGLLFPNGIALSKNEDFLVFAESSGARVMRMDLKGNNKNSVSVFAEGLPGVPDNVRFDGQDGFLVSLVGPADESHPSLLITLGPFPNIRKFLARALYLLELPFIQINNVYPNYFTRRAIHSIGHLSITKPLIPDGVNIVRLDSMGEITDALVGRDGSVSHVSDMIVTGDHILLASPYNNFIGRVPRPNHPHHVTVKSVRFEPAEDESAARKAAEEAKASKAREEQAKKAAEAASKAKRDAETAAARKAAEEAARIKKEAESAAQKAAEQAKAKAAEEAKKKMAAEAQARKAAEEARAKKAAEDAAKKAAEEAKAKRAAEEAAKRAAEEAKAKKLAEEAKQAKAKAAEELAKKKAAEELAKKASEESKPKKAAGNANKN